MNSQELLQKLQLGVKYKQNCELGYGDAHVLLKHIESVMDAIREQNGLLVELTSSLKIAQDTISTQNLIIAELKQFAENIGKEIDAGMKMIKKTPKKKGKKK